MAIFWNEEITGQKNTTECCSKCNKVLTTDTGTYEGFYNATYFEELIDDISKVSTRKHFCCRCIPS